MGQEKTYKIVFERKSCIGAAACAAISPDFWVMNEDGKADLVGAGVDADGNQVLIVKESQMSKDMKTVLDSNKDAAEVCPVQVIKIFDNETGERIV